MGIIFSSARPWQQQWHFNTGGPSDITGWSSYGTSLSSARAGAAVLVTKSRAYLIGGQDAGGAVVKTVLTAVINTDGTLGSWSAGTDIPGELNVTTLVVTKNRVYLLGGVNVSAVNVATVYTAPINTDGTLGTWTTETTNPLPAAIRLSSSIVTKNRVYVIGGVNSSAASIDTIYTAAIDEDGVIGTWETDSNVLPVAIRQPAIITTRNRAYIFGGYTTDEVDDVYTTTINEDGTLNEFVADAQSLPAARTALQYVVTNNRVFLSSGFVPLAFASYSLIKE
jgi:N-acetylneuraminic acid mutarotase